MAISRTELESMDRDDLVDTIDELDDRVRDLEGLTKALQTQNDLLKTAIAGSPGEFATWEVESMVSLHDRVERVSDTVSEHEDRFQMFVVEDGGQATPDERAMHLRQVLLNDAENNEDATMARSTAGKTLGGGLHKGTVLDAMKRAADGSEADIDGSSDLQPVEAITFNTGGTVGSDGQARQSHLQIDTANLTGTEGRQILTTDSGKGGGSE